MLGYLRGKSLSFEQTSNHVALYYMQIAEYLQINIGYVRMQNLYRQKVTI